jgi:cell division transport system permease protein
MAILRRRSDLPLERDESSRFIPWIIALMVYLATLALAGALVANSAVERWSRGLSGSLTVQIMPGEDSDAKERDVRVETAMALLLGTPGVTHAEVLSDQRIARLLAPWLGEEAMRELPLPALIDVRIEPGAALDLKALGERLAEAVPGATLDDHQRWLSQLVRLGRSVELVAAIILALIGMAAAAATVFGTRTALAVHRNVIEVMHLIGAPDSYVARQFQAHALALGLRGGVLGLVGAVATLFGVEYLAGPIGTGLVPNFALLPWQWGVLVLLPLATALIAMVTARATVLRSLARMV